MSKFYIEVVIMTLKNLLRHCVALTAALAVLLGMTTVGYGEIYLPQILKVGLYYGSSAKSVVILTSERGFYAGRYDDRTFVEDRIIENKTLIVRISDNGQISVDDENGNTLYVESGNNGIGLRPFYTDYWEERFTIEGSGYRGSINFIKDGSGFAAINMVDIDQYLYGVVSREMSESWPLEALKAQAICSRNYAAQNIGKHSSYGFDICANTHCQMYTGMSREAQSIYDAVDATRGQVMAYDGELCQLYYSSSMGSTTEDVKYVWGNEVPYLVSVDNSYEDTENIPNGVWSGVLTVEEASTLMRNKGYDVGDVQKIEALEYSPEGRVTKLRVTGNTAIKTLLLEECRTVFGTVTKSQMFTVVGDGDAQAQAYIAVTDGSSLIRKRPTQIELLTGMGRAEFSGDTLYATNGRYQQTYADADEASVPNKSFIFKGTGWGHGVGMSQYGAKGMAENGYTYDAILTHYFSGAYIETVY